MVSSVQNTQAADLFAQLGAASKTGGNSAVSDTQDRFLKLLVTQMQNQDPLNPMDNAQVTSQMAQLSTVTGIDKLNATLQALSDSMLGNQSLQAATMIGHGVMLEGDDLSLQNGAPVKAGLELPQSVQGLTVSVMNRSGEVVRKVELGSQAAGMVHWEWDGLDDAGKALSDGAYRYDVMAVQGGVPVDVTKLQYGSVNSVTQGASGVTLGVGQMSDISLSQIKQIL